MKADRDAKVVLSAFSMRRNVEKLKLQKCGEEGVEKYLKVGIWHLRLNS